MRFAATFEIDFKLTSNGRRNFYAAGTFEKRTKLVVFWINCKVT
jgi:hypothetical protein